MRILWFCNSSSNYERDDKHTYNGGGWINSLETEMSKQDNIELAVSFLGQSDSFKTTLHGVTYYPISFMPYSCKAKLLCKFRYKNFEYEREEWYKFTDPMLKVINDFKPDIIEIFGTELPFSLIGKETKIPVIVHIQGLLNPYWLTFFYNKLSFFSYICSDCNLKHQYKRYKEVVGFRRSAWREREEAKCVNHFIGRTEWSRRVIKALNPKATYHYGGEILRSVFYQSKDRLIPDTLTIISTLSQPMYKGFDLVLYTAKLLCDSYCIDFKWKVFGNVKPRLAESVTGISHKDVNVELAGVISAERLSDEMSKATLYVHTSYIENSPNSICEAQMVGLSVVATNVGGVSSLIDDGSTGFLVPAHDPYQLAYMIVQIYENKQLNLRIGEHARDAALKRHDKKRIITELINTYKAIIQ